VRPAKTGIDIGAVGMYYRIRDASSDVVAFEPIPLFNNMLRAVFEGKRGHIEPVAVSAAPGKVTMRLPYTQGAVRPGDDRAQPAQRDSSAGRGVRGPGRSIVRQVIGFIKVDVEATSCGAGRHPKRPRQAPPQPADRVQRRSRGGTKRLARGSPTTTTRSA
jgi:hypothetical protein